MPGLDLGREGGCADCNLKWFSSSCLKSPGITCGLAHHNFLPNPFPFTTHQCCNWWCTARYIDGAVKQSKTEGRVATVAWLLAACYSSRFAATWSWFVRSECYECSVFFFIFNCELVWSLEVKQPGVRPRNTCNEFCLSVDFLSSFDLIRFAEPIVVFFDFKICDVFVLQVAVKEILIKGGGYCWCPLKMCTSGLLSSLPEDVYATSAYVISWSYTSVVVTSCSNFTVAQLIEALRYKPECRWFYSRWCHWDFSLT
jgi:hypothetical protein